MDIPSLFLAAAEAVPSTADGAAGAANPISDLAGTFKVQWEMVAAQMVSFTIVAVLLWKFAFKPVVATLDERQKKIDDGLQYAEEMRNKLAEAERKEAETLKKAQQEAQEIITEARETAKAHLDKQMQDATRRVEETIQKGNEAIELERRKMLSEVRQEVARLVVATTAKVLDKELAEDDRRKFSESASRELAGPN